MTIATVRDRAGHRSGQETEMQWNEPEVKKGRNGKGERAKEPYI